MTDDIKERLRDCPSMAHCRDREARIAELEAKLIEEQANGTRAWNRVESLEAQLHESMQNAASWEDAHAKAFTQLAAAREALTKIRRQVVEECAKVKVDLYGIGGRSADYLTGFEDACKAYIKAIRAIAPATGGDNGK
jgi:chromosome segregation ATPase